MSQPAIEPCGEHAPSCLYVESCARFCSCGDRWRCTTCRRSWVNRLHRSNTRWLSAALATSGEAWFALLTMRTAEDWVRETDALWERWRRLGRIRSQEKRRRVPKTGLVWIRRAVACLHLTNKAGTFMPHLHAVFVTDSNTDANDIVHTWQAMGDGFADVQPADSLAASVRYSIKGPLPHSVEDLKAISAAMRGQRLVRRIGR